MAELEAVTTVARTGGFRAAARELGMSSSALSHAIAALEARLGVRLFNRTTRSVVLSPAGEQFVAEVGPALAAIDEAVESLGEHGIEPVREDVATGRLVAVLEDWSPPYPGLTLYFAGRRYIPARLRALIDLIRELDYR